VLDFGLHEGEDTDFYLACGASVIAFEANKKLVERSADRFRAEIAAGWLKIVEGAIVPPDFAEKEQTFYVDNRKSVWGTTQLAFAERNSHLGSTVTEVRVPAVDLKAILAANPEIFYAKIDIEGADRLVLDTFKVTGARPKFISIESDKLDLRQVIEEIETLQGLGFTRFAAVQQAAVPGSTFRSRRFDGTPLNYRFANHASGAFGPYLQQEFKRAEQVIDDYRSIFRAYHRFGDQSWLMRNPWRCVTRAMNFALVKTFKKPLCGWYDTHAAR
jgi:FkbM family methyltransferase